MAESDTTTETIHAELQEARADVVKLRGYVQQLAGYLEGLLSEGEFPHKGRSLDAQNATEEWWSERLCAIKEARKFLETLE